MIVYYVNKIDTANGCKHLHVYKLNMPSYEDKDFYKQTTALSCFWSYKKKRNWDNKIFYHLRRDWDWELANDAWIKTCNELGLDLTQNDQRLFPTTECSGIWEFFDAINYDYKKKKYVKNS